MSSTIKICLLQPKITENIEENLNTIKKYSFSAVKQYNPDILVFPQNWISTDIIKSITETKSKSDYTKDLIQILKQISIETNTFLVGGSIPEFDEKEDVFFNTCFCFDNKGNSVLKHRQVHMLNVQLKENFQKGSSVSYFNSPFGKIGVGIGDDLRYHEYTSMLKKERCDLVLFPLCSNEFDESYHVILQGRALDNNIFIGACCYYDMNTSNISNGNVCSCIVNPYGEIIIKSYNQEGIIMGVVDLSKITEIEESIPTLIQKRLDLYEIISVNK